MDNSTLRWSTHPGLVAIGWVLAAGATAAAVASSGSADRAGMLLFGVGAVSLAAASAYGTFVRPRLAADREGLHLRTLGGTRQLPWDAARVELTTIRRMGRDQPVLEIEPRQAFDDVDPGMLTVLGWLELGADPRDVHDELEALRR